MTSDGARVNLPQKTERLVRRIAAVVILFGTLGAFAVAAGVLGAFAVAAGNLRFPFLGFWYLFAPVAASVMAAIVLRGGGSWGQVWRAAANFFLPTLVVWFFVLAFLLSRAGG